MHSLRNRISPGSPLLFPTHFFSNAITFSVCRRIIAICPVAKVLNHLQLPRRIASRQPRNLLAQFVNRSAQSSPSQAMQPIRINTFRLSVSLRSLRARPAFSSRSIAAVIAPVVKPRQTRKVARSHVPATVDIVQTLHVGYGHPDHIRNRLVKQDRPRTNLTPDLQPDLPYQLLPLARICHIVYFIIISNIEIISN